MRKLSTIIVAFAFLAVASMSYAAQTVGINVTSEPITSGSTCGKAGGFTLSFDHGTVLTEGDKITFDLDLNTTLCKDIDLIIAPYGNATTYTGIAAAAGAAMSTISNAASAITATDLANDQFTMDVGSDAGDTMYFRLKGSAGSARVTLYVLGTDTTTQDATFTFDALTAGDSSDVLIFKFLSGTDYATLDAAADISIYDVVDSTPTYATADTEANSLCIDISETSAATINANFDSSDDIYTFVPSNPQVAHVVTGSTYSLYEAKLRETGNIPLPEAGSQTETCAYIVNDSESDTYWCDTGDTHNDNELIVETTSAYALDGDVQVTYEILVNGESGNNGVYWGSTSDSITTAVDTDPAAVLTVGAAATGALSFTAYESDGSTTVATLDSSPSDCEVDDANKAVILKGSAPAATLNLNGGLYNYFYLPIGNMVYDTSEIQEGDVVSVKVTIETLPCGTIIDGETWEIGTFGCVASSTSYTQRYPYFAKTTGSYANALIITNVGSNDGTAELTLYEEDGDIFTASVDVTAYGMVVDLVGNLTWTATAASAGSGTVGDARGWIDLSADFSVDGAAMITNASTGESIGYLPRQ